MTSSEILRVFDLPLVVFLPQQVAAESVQHQAQKICSKGVCRFAIMITVTNKYAFLSGLQKFAAPLGKHMQIFAPM